MPFTIKSRIFSVFHFLSKSVKIKIDCLLRDIGVKLVSQNKGRIQAERVRELTAQRTFEHNREEVQRNRGGEYIVRNLTSDRPHQTLCK
jgi:hypothetical protein